MEGLDTTIVWMLGVVAAMLVFGIAAAIGYYKNPQQDKTDNQE